MVIRNCDFKFCNASSSRAASSIAVVDVVSVSSSVAVEKRRNLLQLPTLVDVDEGLCSLDDIVDIACRLVLVDVSIDRVNADAVVAIIAADVRYAVILKFIVLSIAESVYILCLKC